jgi:uncharacterized membrane protein YraQ (UPF0718 family)
MAEMAPYLILGFITAGLIHVLIPMELIAGHLGKKSLFSVLKAALFGIPIPLCSCGVLPVATGLKKSGASNPATLSFLITTPATGADSILATGALLGWSFTLIRTLSSFFIGMVAGIISSFMRNKKEIDPEQKNTCKSSRGFTLRNDRTIIEKIKAVFAYAIIDLPRSFSGSLLTGIILGGLISTLISPRSVQNYLGNGISEIIIATLIAIPMYVCATGSIPIAAALITAGFSPGAALAFLIAGPATNTVAIITVKKILDKKNLIVYLIVIFSGAVFAGILLDFFKIQLPIHNVLEEHTDGLSWFKNLCGILLSGNILFIFLQKQIVKLKTEK